MSGTFAPDKNGNAVVDVTLEGGPVKTLKYTIGEDMLLEEAKKVNLKIIANGQEMNIEYSPGL